jgi:hypothetical protein
MDTSTWSAALSELAEAVSAAFVRFWKQDIVQVGLTLGMFLALALPLLLVMLVLWYLDSTGWRPDSGFYKIGLAPEAVVSDATMVAAGFAAFFVDVKERVRRPGPAE